MRFLQVLLRRSSWKVLRLGITLVLAAMMILPGFAFAQTLSYAGMANNALANFHGTGQPAPVYWPGNDQRITNPSFETGNIQPWSQLVYNSYASTAQVLPPGYNSNLAAQLSVISGNVSTYSSTTLLQDLSLNQVGFGIGVMLQGAAQVQALQGNTSSDRVEIMVTLDSSIGNVTRLHYVFASGLGLFPANSTTDAYYKVTNFGSPGWISISRNLNTDMQSTFPSLYRSVNAVKNVQLAVYAQSLRNATYDPRVKYVETGGDSYWNTTEAVVYDSDLDGVYHVGDTILYNTGGPLTDPTPLSNDRMIKYIDTNVNGRWDLGEYVVYDKFNEGFYDTFNDFVIYPVIPPAKPPVAGTLFFDPIRKSTVALIDQVQLTAVAASQSWMVNGPFESGGLVGWGRNTTFALSTTTAHTGLHSAYGTVTNGNAQLSQSIDADPIVNAWTTLQASVNTVLVSGTSSQDLVDFWLGLSDKNGSPLSLYYVFASGNGLLPSNSTGVEYIEVPGYGAVGQWTTITRGLAIDTVAFTLQGYAPPYSIDLIVLEVNAQGPSAATQAYFDDISIQSPATNSGLAATNFYAVDGKNSTYAYTVSNIPSSSFSVQIPRGQSILNITSPTNAALQASDYNTTQPSPALTTVNIPGITGSRYATGGTWHFFTTSKNIVSNLFAVDASTKSPGSSFAPSSRVDLVAQLQDPLGSPIPNATTTFSLTDSQGTIIGNWQYAASGRGFFNATSVSLPSSPGTYTLQTNSSSIFYAGLKTTQITITGTPWLLILCIAIAVAGITIIGLLFFRTRRKTKFATQSSSGTVASAKKSVTTAIQRR